MIARIARRIVGKVSAREIRQSSAEPHHCAKDRDSRERELEQLRERVAELERQVQAHADPVLDQPDAATAPAQTKGVANAARGRARPTDFSPRIFLSEFSASYFLFAFRVRSCWSVTVFNG